jgi:hypothetical protein
MDYEKLVLAYRNIRDHKQQLNRDHDAVIKDLDDKLERIESVMLDELNTNKGEGIRTAAGTFFRKLEVIPTGRDWDAFYEWIKDNDAFDALERRIKRTFISEYMNSHDGSIPPGVDVFRRYKVEVRKPTND